MSDPRRVEKEIARRIEVLTMHIDGPAQGGLINDGPVTRSQKRVRAELEDLARWAVDTAPLQDECLIAHNELDVHDVPRKSEAGNTLLLWFRIKLLAERLL